MSVLLVFFESWLKFRAPGITLPMGLRVGKKVFNALNKVEWTLFVITIVLKVLSADQPQLTGLVFLGSPLLLQTFYFLPILNQRAEKIIAGETVSPSWHHVGYVIADIIKLIILIGLTLVIVEIKC
ncbi:MAG: hypothetical protein ACP5PS_03870 [Bacteroidales bacterium]